MAFCATKGCKNVVRGARRHCDAHRDAPRVCADDDCGALLGVANRSGYCTAHNYVAQKIKREAIEKLTRIAERRREAERNR